MKTFEQKFKQHIIKHFPEWGELWNTPLFEMYLKIHSSFPFLNAGQVVNLLSYCGGYDNLIKCTQRKTGYLCGKQLAKIPGIGYTTMLKLTTNR